MRKQEHEVDDGYCSAEDTNTGGINGRQTPHTAFLILVGLNIKNVVLLQLELGHRHDTGIIEVKSLDDALTIWLSTDKQDVVTPAL